MDNERPQQEPEVICDPLSRVIDPWQHRSSGLKCSTCMWFARKNPGTLNPSQIIGRCRRHAPAMSGYPVVYPHDWCGDHKLDETKI